MSNLDEAATEAAQKLRCSELLLVNVEVPHKVSRKEHWLYVYDQDMLTSRVTLMDNLASSNAPEGISHWNMMLLLPAALLLASYLGWESSTRTLM